MKFLIFLLAVAFAQECPEQAPDIDGTCTEEQAGLHCEYSPTTCCEGLETEEIFMTTFADCDGTQWWIAMADIVCPQCSGCPSTRPEGSCVGNEGLICSYNPMTCCEGSLNEEVTFTTLAECADSGEWLIAELDILCPACEDLDARCLEENSDLDCSGNGDYCDYFAWRWKYKNGRCTLLGAGSDCGNFHTKDECVNTCKCPAQQPERGANCDRTQICYYGEKCCEGEGIMETDNICKCEPQLGWQCRSRICGECVEDCFADPSLTEECRVGVVSDGTCCSQYEDGSACRDDGYCLPCLEKKSLDSPNSDINAAEDSDVAVQSQSPYVNWELPVYISAGGVLLVLISLGIVFKRRRDLRKRAAGGDTNGPIPVELVEVDEEDA